VVHRLFSVLLNSILSFFGGLERLYKVVLFDLVQQKRYTTSKILVVVTKVRPSFLPDLINMTPTTIAPSDTQMPGSVTQPTPPTTFNPTGDDTPPSSVPTGDDIADEDDVSTVVRTGDDQAPLEQIEYNIKLLMTNKQDNSADSKLGTGNPMTDFKIQAILTFTFLVPCW
jgi:hypothetical protein